MNANVLRTKLLQQSQNSIQSPLTVRDTILVLILLAQLFLCQSQETNMFWLFQSDYFTKWVCASALPTKEANGVATVKDIFEISIKNCIRIVIAVAIHHWKVCYMLKDQKMQVTHIAFMRVGLGFDNCVSDNNFIDVNLCSFWCWFQKCLYFVCVTYRTSKLSLRKGVVWRIISL